MAYSRTPVEDTYSSHIVPFFTEPDIANFDYTGDYGPQSVNFIPELATDKVNGEQIYYARTRPGLSTVGAGSVAGWGMSNARGLYSFQGNLFSVYGNILYMWYTPIQVLPTNTGNVGFTEFLTSTGTKYLILCDGISGYRITAAGAVTQIVDPDFPTPHIPTPVFMDGYLFLPKTNSQDIYNSDLDNPLNWTPGNFISAESFPDDIRAIVKNNQYLYAFSSQSIEVFYNAGIASGSPLQRQQSKVFQFGILGYQCIAAQGENLCAIVQDGSGAPWIASIRGFEYEKISTPAIIDALTKSSVDYTTNLSCYCLTLLNQKFLVILINKTSVSSSATVVYSFDTKQWLFWRFRNERGFHANFCTQSSLDSRVYFQGNSQDYLWNAGSSGNTAGTNSGRDRVLLGGVTTEYEIISTIRTPKLDFGTQNRKFISSLSISCDPFWPLLVPTGTPDGADPSIITINWNDSDFNKPDSGTSQTASLYTRSAGVLQNKTIYRLGYTKERSFTFTYNSMYPLRLKYFEVKINKGRN